MRDVIVRYKQTWLGLAWSVVRPLINILIFGVLSYLVDRSGSFSERFVTSAAGVVLWQLISTIISESANSLTSNSNILTKVYFPKLLLPVSSILVCIVDFLIAFVLFLAIYLWFHGLPGAKILLMPFVLLHTVLFSFAVGISVATASVRYRDIKIILPFFLQILFYASPVFISTGYVLGSGLPDWMKVAYQLNPLVFMMDAFRYCFFENAPLTALPYAVSSILVTLLLMAHSLRYFFRFERNIADYI
jgi:lipopolysaccharide transport system permease protein